MKLNKFTDYSLRVLIFLALKREERSTVFEISEKYHISNNHLIKVVHNLSKIGLIHSYKGRGGGIVLALDAKDINIGKTIMTLEEESFLAECFSDSDKCKISSSCILKSALGKAKKSFYEVLETYNLEDLVVNNKSLSKVLLD
jgi:Rrf2 family nitric oxide-sensitive transcriptional repressor